MPKPVVKFTGPCAAQAGGGGWVEDAKGHPHLGSPDWVRTSRVLKITIETENTIYESEFTPTETPPP